MKNKFVTLCACLLAITSCRLSNNINSNSSPSGFDQIGVKNITFDRVFDSTNQQSILSTLVKNFAYTTNVNYSSVSKTLGSDRSIITKTVESNGSFYGEDTNYAKIDEKVTIKLEVNGVYTTEDSAQTWNEYAVGSKKKIFYTKSLIKSQNGSESITYRVNQYSGRPIQYSLYPVYNNAFYYYDVIGIDKLGKLYGIFYSEKCESINSNNKNNTSNAGVSITYSYVLADLNTLANPKYNSIYKVDLVETNVDQNGMVTNSFYVSSKVVTEYKMTYDIITDNESARLALIKECPTVSLFRAKPYCYVTHNTMTERYGYSSIDNPKDGSTFSFPITIMENSYFSFSYDLDLQFLNKETEDYEQIVYDKAAMDLNTNIIYHDDHTLQKVYYGDSYCFYTSVTIEALVTLKTAYDYPYLILDSISVSPVD